MKDPVMHRKRDLFTCPIHFPRFYKPTRRTTQRIGLTIAVVTLLLAPITQGQPSSKNGPEGFVLWSSARIEAAADSLEKELGDKAMVYETIGNYDGHSVYLVLRGVTGSAELHETESDVQISMRGKATSIVGGDLVDPESLPRKQQRGKSINGGQRQQLSPGDIMHITPGVPHQLLIDPEDPYMYILIKIDEEPLQ